MVLETMQRGIQSPMGTTVSLEYRYRHKKGHWVVLSAIGSNYLEDPVIQGIVVHFRDVTERKKAEQEVLQLKEKYELAINGSNDGIWDWDLRENSLYLSKRWKEILGYEDAELENSFSTFGSLIHPDEVEMVNEYVQKYLDGRGTVSHGACLGCRRARNLGLGP